MIDACIFQSICWVVSMVIVPLCSSNVGYLEVQSGSVLSFSGGDMFHSVCVL